MQKQDELLKEFEDKFDTMKTELKFKATLQELEDFFFLNDFILQSGFVSTRLDRAVCSRMRDTLSILLQTLQGWITPNPYQMVSLSESQIFSDEEKEEMNRISKKVLALITDNQLAGLTQSRQMESKFIDDALHLSKEITPIFISFIEKTNNYWKTPEIKKRN